eukprot:3361010-Rhodomonas_salina.1
MAGGRHGLERAALRFEAVLAVEGNLSPTRDGAKVLRIPGPDETRDLLPEGHVLARFLLAQSLHTLGRVRESVEHYIGVIAVRVRWVYCEGVSRMLRGVRRTCCGSVRRGYTGCDARHLLRCCVYAGVSVCAGLYMYVCVCACVCACGCAQTRTR